jgi:hypothetical protein
MSSSTLATGSWTTTDDLPAVASWHGQHDGPIQLPAGKVLLGGGANAAGEAVSQAALYDTAAGTWAATGSLKAARKLHTATLLGNGKVLVAGGIGAGAQFPAPGLPSAELFDPVAGTWAATGNLHGGRWGHSAVALQDGRVLVAGGRTIRNGQSVRALRTAELYDPTAGTWTETGAMTDARGGHSAIVLQSGKVLVCGGTVTVSRDDEAPLAFCELYDPTAGTWAPTGSLLSPRGQHQATPLTGTTVLVTGGAAPGVTGGGEFDPFSQATAELYTQSTGAWTEAAPMPGGRALHRAVPLGAGQALVVGGTGGERDGAGFESALIYNATGDTWEQAGGLATGRWAFAAVALSGGRVLVAGGVTRSGLAASDPDADELTASTEVFDT